MVSRLLHLKLSNNEQRPEIIISFFQSKIFKDYVLKIFMNFCQYDFPEKNLFENICKKHEFWGNYPYIFSLAGQSCAGVTANSPTATNCVSSYDLRAIH